MDVVDMSHQSWRIVFPDSLYRALHAHLFPGDGDEHGAVLACGLSTTSDKVRLLARTLFKATDGVDYVSSDRAYRRLTADFVRRHIKYCRDERLVYLSIHNHHGTDSVQFSATDLASHERGYPALVDIGRGMPVGALVFAENAIAGDIWLPDGGRIALDRADIIGRSRQILWPSPPVEVTCYDSMHDRQARIFGTAGQAILHDTKVGIIGLGGVGSLVAEYLGRLGVGGFVLIDPERIEPTNLSRVVGSTHRDALCGLRRSLPFTWAARLADRWSTPKVEIARRVIQQVNRGAMINAIQEDALAHSNASLLLSCDYIFLAADTAAARLLFNAIVHQHYIPGVQIGSKVSSDLTSGAITDVFSVVRPVAPGEGCLWCNELIDPVKLQEEGMSDGELRANRYLDADVAQPSVITLNALGAAHAVNDFLFYITGLMKPNASTDYMRHFARRRQTSLIVPRSDPACTECGPAQHSRLGRGDARRLPCRE